MEPMCLLQKSQFSHLSASGENNSDRGEGGNGVVGVGGDESTWDFPGKSGGWTSHFHCRCVGSVPSQGTRILHEVWPDQKKKKSERGDNDGDETILWWWLVVMVANTKP